MNKKCTHNLYVAVSYIHPVYTWQKVMLFKCSNEGCDYTIIKRMPIIAAEIMRFLKPASKTKLLNRPYSNNKAA